MPETIQIDKRLTLDIEYEYYEKVPALMSGGAIYVPEETAHIGIRSVSIQGSQIMYSKKLFAELAERIMEDYE